jgi:hypothetical protein
MNEKTDEKPERLGDDLLIGAEAIAAELGVDAHTVYYFHRKRKLPIGKLGKNLIASRRKLQRALAALTA